MEKSNAAERALPTILAGPILRRVEPSQACIWMACSTPVTARVNIFAFQGSATSTDSIEAFSKPVLAGTGLSKSLQLGKNLHILLVIARPITAGTDNSLAHFPSDTLLAYDIEIAETDGLSGVTRNLKSLGLAEGKNSIVYAAQGLSLPTFFIKSKNSPLNILHGSCRKLHGKGKDCLEVADDLISASVIDLSKRPSALFLTGDQIYADDVSDALILHITRLGSRLLGYEEKINGINARLSEIPVGGRKEIAKSAGFTSGHAGNHLLSFGEFAAMYLVAWNAENWPAGFPAASGGKQRRKRKYEVEVEQLESAKSSLLKIRRALANIPTYMICDDHDITDDWNISMEWQQNVSKSKFGNQVIANGLAAYWAFQAWGNDPAQFSEDFISKTTKYLANKENSKADSALFINHILGFHNWTFSCPTSPLTVFLDCRTQRKYDSFSGPAQLASDDALQSLVRAATQGNYVKGDQIIVVVPTPVFGFDLVEKIQQFLARFTNVYSVDLETWSANRAGFVKFLSHIATALAPRQCIFLSGDVHYGFTIKAKFSIQESDISLEVAQLNSSALKATSLGKEVALGKVLGHLRQIVSRKPSAAKGTIHVTSPRLPQGATNYNDEGIIQNNYGKTSLDWSASWSIISTRSTIPQLVIAANNIGLVTVEKDGSTSQSLMVKTRRGNTIPYNTLIQPRRQEGGITAKKPDSSSGCIVGQTVADENTA